MQQNVSFVLVRPVYLGNIGSVARALKNFGFRRLRMVSPPSNYKDAEARKMSVGAFDVLKNAEIFSSLSDALKDVNYAVGTTSGQQRDFNPLPLPSLSRDIVKTCHSNHVAVVFGDERNGLSKDELERCHSIVTIPTNPEFPALNMSQAVTVFAYELSRETALESTEVSSLSSGESDDKLFSLLGDVLDAAQFTRSFNRDLVMQQLRTFYQRAKPTERESSLLTGALHRLNQRLTGSRG